MARFATQRGLDRLVNFSDATVAIAVTVLVLPLAELAGQAHRGGVDAFLADHASDIGAFVISFLVIAVLWREHHRLFELLVSYDGPLLVLNFVWLFAIVVIPFSTAITQDQPAHDRLSSAFYLGNLLLAFVALAAMHLVARYDPPVMDPGCRRTFRVGPSIVFAAICAVALIVAVTVPAIGRFAVFLLPLTDLVWLAVEKTAGRDLRYRESSD
ncbi:TMEM175 family protein [Pseudonocardia adelaidensis]